MSNRSKARKSGEYVGGRPWPVVCPVCRHCGGGPPQYFYRARGLCNICYKKLRNSPELDQYHALPDCCSDVSYRSLIKNPEKWLQREMGGTHTSRFRTPEAIKAEAQRIFDVAVRRWYGEETPPDKGPWELSYEERAWADTGGDPGPASQADLVNLKNAARARRESEHRRRFLKLWKDLGSKAHAAVGWVTGGARKPKVIGIRGSLTITWGLGATSVSITFTKADAFVVVERGWTVIREEDFSLQQFPSLVRWATSFNE